MITAPTQLKSALTLSSVILFMDYTTFISEINNGSFSTWPGLKAELISKHLPKSLATAKGHNKLARKNVR